MTTPPPAPARWPALPFVLLAALLLPGCALLRGGADGAPAEHADAPAAAAPGTAASDAAPTPAVAFDLQVRSGNADLDAFLADNLQLQRFRRLPDLQASELRRLAGAAQDDARALLATRGFFSPAVSVDLQEHAQPPAQPAPASAGAPQPPAQPAYTVALHVTPGVQTQVADVQLALQGPQGSDGAPLQRAQRQLQRGLALQPGTAFTQSDWSADKAGALRSLQAQRYPLARLESSRADVDAAQAQAHLQLHYASGPAVRFGALRIEGGRRYDAQGLANVARLPAGQDYSQSALLDAQQRLAASGYFDSVFLNLDTSGIAPGAAQASAPVVAQVRDAPLQKLSLGLGFSTDSGARVSLDHIHNRLPPLGWRALSQLSLDEKNKRASTEWTDLPGADGWRWFAGALLQREATGSYQVDSSRLRAGRRQESGHIDRSLYLQHDQARSQGDDAPPTSGAISVNYGWTGRYFNNAANPTGGWGLGAELGLGSTLVPGREPFARLLLRTEGFVPLARVDMGAGVHRRSRLALRATAGAVLARPDVPIPVTQLFLTGGDTTVRGYGWRSIGARTHGGELFGGRYLAVGSLEWQRPITLRGNRSDFESAWFVDAGAVADEPGRMQARVGVGAGLRWNSPVGPLQADLAYGLQSHQVRLHLRLGYQF